MALHKKVFTYNVESSDFYEDVRDAMRNCINDIEENNYSPWYDVEEITIYKDSDEGCYTYRIAVNFECPKDRRDVRINS